MPFLPFIYALILLGVALYLINLIPMEAWVKQVIRVLAILGVVLWILQGTQLLGPVPLWPRQR